MVDSMSCLNKKRDPFGAIVVQRPGIALLMPSEKVEISPRNQRVAEASVAPFEPPTPGLRSREIALTKASKGIGIHE